MSPASRPPAVLVVDDDAEIRYSLTRVLSPRHYAVQAAASGEEAISLVKKGAAPDLIFLDIRMGGMSGIETLQHLRSVNPRQLVILMTAYGTAQTAIEAMKYGAFDYIMKPFDPRKVLALAENALKTHEDLRQVGEYKPMLNSDDYKEGIVGSSEAMQEVFKIIGQVTASDATVMITGESGTGKELVARCIYQHSHRSNKPFIAVNCAAIPDNLIESELFGHERGSFTGATSQRIGKFELCDGGTIFLDEIGDMALATQTKILRVLQEGEIQRVGGVDTLKVNVRILAATNKHLEDMVRAKTFREDLYYRLNVVRIRLPALRERVQDIPQIIDYLLQKLEKAKKARGRKVSPEALALLSRYRWPGNVRELENVIYRSAVVAQGDALLIKDLPPEIREAAGAPPARAPEETLPPAAPPLAEVSSAPTAVETPGPITPPSALVPSPPIEEPAPSSEPTASPLAKPDDELSLGQTFDLVYQKIRAHSTEPILEILEREMIVRALDETDGNQVKASELLGITRATLRKRIETLGLKL